MTERTQWERDFWKIDPLLKGKTVFVLASGPSMTQRVADRLRGHHVIVINCTFKIAPWADVWFFTDNNIVFDREDKEGRPLSFVHPDGTVMTDVVENWPGMIATISRQAKRVFDDPKIRRGRPPRILRIKQEPWDEGFPPIGSGTIKHGRTSGHSAIALAVAMGAKRVILLGFDMRLVLRDENAVYPDPQPGSASEKAILRDPSHPRWNEMYARYFEHHHSDYAIQQPKRDVEIYEREFIPSFGPYTNSLGRRVIGWNECAQRIGVEILNATPGSALKEFRQVSLDEVLLCAA